MKKILIFGACSSIAKCCARIWAKRGSALYLVGRNEEHLETLAKDLKIRGAAKVYSYVADINLIEKHLFILKSAEQSMIGIDSVFIAHGSLPNQKVCEQSIDMTIEEIKTNSISTISILTIAANYFEKKGVGNISVISSIAGDRGKSSNYIYGASKAMVTTFTSGLRQRLFKSNVTVVTIKPGFVDTPMTKSFEKGLLWVKPEVIAKKIVKAIDDNRNDEVYLPFFWWIIINIIKIIPQSIFKRIKL